LGRENYKKEENLLGGLEAESILPLATAMKGDQITVK